MVFIDVVWYFEKNDAPSELLIVRNRGQNQSGSNTKDNTTKRKK